MYYQYSIITLSVRYYFEMFEHAEFAEIHVGITHPVNLCSTVHRSNLQIYRFAADSVCLSSLPSTQRAASPFTTATYSRPTHSQLRKTCKTYVVALRSFKVIQGHRHWYQSKPVYFVVVFHCSYTPIASEIQRYISRKCAFLAVFTHSSVQSRLKPSLGMGRVV